ncbi:hypothetical protein GI374_16860 [Paracoccus sp. S-4012]|uniref:hypothetical protein n=1 Tax=Paracoccus sp. S-4012 TaxID=2665648 RepID=UPI0012B14847|nr:hypothetical protein [Paracoccus sp. S-4012]MRX52050.1 hypothetical protein [Paracoccus sp. S-4012]
MTALPEPLQEARAKARMIGTRARAIADLADRIGYPADMTPEEWDGLSRGFSTLLDELGDEVEIFAQKASHAS